MSKQNFEKEKVQVEYTPTFGGFQTDPTVGTYDKKHKGTEAADLVRKLRTPADWSFKGVLKKDGTLERILEITYPRTNNGHQATGGWCWQLDVKAVGSGSKDRLVLACTPGNVQIAQRAGTPVQVGTEKYKKIDATLTLNGTFRAIENYH